jgi:thioredoxin reductase
MNRCDVAVIGAGPAGVSAALMAQSVDLNVVVFDAAGICQQLNHIPKLSNLFGLPQSGREIAMAAELQIKTSKIPFIEAAVRSLLPVEKGWNVTLDDAAVHWSAAIILATGTRPTRLSESSLVTTDIECAPLHLTTPSSLTGSPVVVVGCDRIFWTWAER